MIDQIEMTLDISPLLDSLRQRISAGLPGSDQDGYLKARIAEEGLEELQETILNQFIAYRMSRELQEDPALVREFILASYPDLLFEPILQVITENTTRAISASLTSSVSQDYLPLYEQTLQVTMELVFQA